MKWLKERRRKAQQRVEAARLERRQAIANCRICDRNGVVMSPLNAAMGGGLYVRCDHVRT